MTTTYTSNLRLQKPDFRSSGWGDQLSSNMDTIDSAIQNALTTLNITPWTINTAMTVGQIKSDTAVSPPTYWICGVAHTSGSSTFVADRGTHPTFWNAITFALKPRGAWAHSTAYAVNDVAYDSSLGITGICKIAHTSNTLASGGNIQTDVANWDFIVNLPAMGVTAATTISFSNAVAVLSGSPTNVQTAIEALDASNDSQGTTLASHTISIGTLTTNQATNTANIATNTSDIASHGTRLTTDEGNIATHTTQIAALTSANTPIGGYLWGLTLSTAGSSTSFTVAAGSCINSANATYYSLASPMIKTTASWVASSGNGGIDTGAIAPSTWYHVFLILNPTSHAVDVIFSATATPSAGPAMPAGYTLFRRIGSMKTDGSSKWTKFVQLGDEFLWDTPVADANNSALSTTATLYTLTVPTGLQVNALFRGLFTNAGSGNILLINSPDEAVAVVNVPAGNTTGQNPLAGGSSGAEFTLNIRTNTSAQIRAVSQSGTVLFIATYGWIDTRGRLY